MLLAVSLPLPDLPPDLSPDERAVLAEISGPSGSPRARQPPRPKAPRPPSKPRAKPTKRPKGPSLGSLARQREVVALRVAGRKYVDIGEELGISASAARKTVERWIHAQKPSEEQTVELRTLMQERLEELHEAYWKRAKGWTDKFGEEHPGDDKAAEFLLKVMDRHSRLMGVDMQPNVTTLLISAESVAKFLGWDPDVDGGVIDVPASEVRELGDGEEEAA